ncbi:MAG: gliding motility-associated C-terminal domain-containing protein [Bacteroidetes bacterium]|nr:gliding motility-associated C-terminal domain-containing protein [Bacteroidota bacterium]
MARSKSLVKKVVIFTFIHFASMSSALFGQVNAGEDLFITSGLPVKLQGEYLGFTGIPVTAGDDPFVGPFEIGFNFVFFGESHSQFAVSPNGLVSFYIPQIIGVSHQEVTAIPNNIFNQTIMGPYQDLFSKPIEPHNQYIYYLTVGSAPQRRLIVGWCDAPMFGCPSQLVTYQIVLNESDSTIVNHIIAKPSCSYLQNMATQGLNYNYDLGISVPGRNAASWESDYESWLYTPDGTSNYTIDTLGFDPEIIVPQGKLEWTWFKDNYPGGEVIGTNPALVVYPLETTTYFVEVTLCGGLKYTDDILVTVHPVPNAFNPNSSVEVNRTFRFFGSPADNITDFRMNIFNRWGQLVYESDNINEGWDGKKNGAFCNPDVYVWVVYYNGEGGKVTNKGSVTLIW